MKFFLSLALLASGVSAFAPASQQTTGTQLMSARSDLEDLAVKSNPTLKFYDPLSLSEADFWGQGDDATIGFLRHSEIKHGRIAMFPSLATVFNLTSFGHGP